MSAFALGSLSSLYAFDVFGSTGVAVGSVGFAVPGSHLKSETALNLSVLTFFYAPNRKP